MSSQRCEEKSAPARGEERECAPFGSSFYMCVLPTGPALCKWAQTGALFVPPEVLTAVLRPSFDLPLFYFRRPFPSLSFSHHRFGLLSSILTT